MASPLSSSKILQCMADALPTHVKDDTASDICNSYEAIALFSHACMIANGFRLLGFSEDQRKGEECAQLAPRLPSKWNSTFNSYSFLYAHEKSSMEYLIKVDRLGTKAEVRGLALGDEKISRFEVTARDYISNAALPIRIQVTPEGEEDRSGLEEKLKEIFISPPRIQDLASLFDLTIIRKLAPNLHKGSEDSSESASSTHVAQSRSEEMNIPQNPFALPRPSIPRPIYPSNDPLAVPPSRPFPAGELLPPGFDDEYDLLRPAPHALPGAGRSPLNIGYDDLNPLGLGPRDPLRGSLVGGGGMAGMHPTFDDPLFGNVGQDNRRPGVPDGARYDPLGPGDRLRRDGRPPNPFGGFGGGGFI